MIPSAWRKRAGALFSSKRKIHVTGDAEDRSAMRVHGPAMPSHRAAMNGHRAAIGGHRAAMAGHRVTMASHRAAMDGHRAAMAGHRAATGGERAAIDSDRGAMRSDHGAMETVAARGTVSETSRTMRPLSFLVPALALVACGGPAPKDASNATPIPITNSAARVANEHAVTEIQDAPQVLAVLAEGDRTPQDRALDEPHQAADPLSFLGLTPGMRVLQLGAGGGYMTELLARSVGASGEVLAINAASASGRPALEEVWRDRLARPANAHVVHVEREFGADLPGEARGLDLVYVAVFYRDLPGLGVDRRLLVARLYDALRPGGRLVVIDRTARDPAAKLDATTLHTEESRNARYEIEHAGFHFETEGRFLRSSTSSDDWNATPASHPTPLDTQDRFVLAFVK